MIRVEFSMDAENKKGQMRSTIFAAGRMHTLPRKGEVIWLQEYSAGSSWEVKLVSHHVREEACATPGYEHDIIIHVKPF